MVYNNAFTIEQRDIVKLTDKGMQVNKSLIEQLVAPINLLILGPVAKGLKDQCSWTLWN